MLWYEISGDEILHEEVNIENTALNGNAELAGWQIVSDAVGSELPGTNPMTISALQNLSDGVATTQSMYR